MNGAVRTPSLLFLVLVCLAGPACRGVVTIVEDYGVGPAEVGAEDGIAAADSLPSLHDINETPEVPALDQDPGAELQPPETVDQAAAPLELTPELPPACPQKRKNVLAGIGEPETAGSLTGIAKPSMALDSLLGVHVVVDKGLPDVYIYHRIEGQWSETLFATAGEYSTARVHCPHIQVDPTDRAWVSGWFGSKGMPGGTMGQGLWVVHNAATAPAKEYIALANEGFKNGRVATDPFEPDFGVVMTRGGIWQKFDASGNKVGSGKMDVGPSGEKIRFLISPRLGQTGVWHAAMSGYSDHSSAYQNSVRHAAGEGKLIWAEYDTYTDMGEDMRHPELGVDLENPEAAYIVIKHKPGVVMNIFDGEKLLFDPFALPVVTPDSNNHGNGSERFAPQFAPVLGGGTFMCWTGADKRIKLRYVDPAGSLGEIHDITGGKQCAMSPDPEGNIHMVYIEGQLKYRKLATTWDCP